MSRSDKKSEKQARAAEAGRPPVTLARAVTMKCWEGGSCYQGMQRTSGKVQHPSRRGPIAAGVKGDGYLSEKNKNTGLGFLSHETKQTEVYAADIASAV